MYSSRILFFFTLGIIKYHIWIDSKQRPGIWQSCTHAWNVHLINSLEPQSCVKGIMRARNKSERPENAWCSFEQLFVSLLFASNWVNNLSTLLEKCKKYCNVLIMGEKRKCYTTEVPCVNFPFLSLSISSVHFSLKGHLRTVIKLAASVTFNPWNHDGL